jgi:predicted deacylase
MTKTEYLKIANDIKSFMDSKLVAPEYAYNTSLGYYLGYENIIFTFSKILDTYNTTRTLMNFVDIKPWYIVSNSFKIDIVIYGTGGYVAANSIMNAYIPRNTETNKIIESAFSGTPMLTFGDGTGPKVMIVAGVHGNELPAQIAAMHLINYLNGKSIRGTVYLIPFAIPSSTAATSRYWNGQNPNSVGNIPGTPVNQILNLARQLNVNALGDFHSSQPGGVPGRDAAMYTKSPTYESYVMASYISGQTGSALVGAYQAGVDYPGALEDVCNLAGVPAVTCEVLSSHGALASGSIEKSFNQMLAFLRYKNII